MSGAETDGGVRSENESFARMDHSGNLARPSRIGGYNVGHDLRDTDPKDWDVCYTVIASLSRQRATGGPVASAKSLFMSSSKACVRNYNDFRHHVIATSPSLVDLLLHTGLRTSISRLTCWH
jgi:hypothetical protein